MSGMSVLSLLSFSPDRKAKTTALVGALQSARRGCSRDSLERCYALQSIYAAGWQPME